MPRTLAKLLPLLLPVLAAAPAPATATTYEDPAFQDRTLAEGLTRPVAVAFGPEGHAYVAEQPGRVRVVPPGGGTPSLLLDVNTRVNSSHDRGLLGIAVDSDFATHPYLYLLYTYELAPLFADQNASPPRPMVSRLTRVRLASPTALADPAQPEEVLLGSYGDGPCPDPSNDLDCIPSDYDSHSIGTVRSAPDGTLWVGSGDAASYNVADPRAFRAYDERSMAGKILHVDRDGRGLPGHPTCPAVADLDDVCTKVWAKGLRNPFRFSLRPDGGLTVGDVGWYEYEEVELIGPGEGGRSYGWPCHEAGIRTPSYNELPACATEYARPAGTHTGPDWSYPHAGSDGGYAVMGGPTYTGSAYPAAYEGDTFVADYGGAWVKRLELNADGSVAQEHDFASDWYSTDLETAPSGDLAYVEYGNGSPGSGALRQVVYSATNRAPVADARAEPGFGPAPLTVQLDGSHSHDADVDPLTYEWELGDGEHASGAQPLHEYEHPGTYVATLTVEDGRGGSDSDTVLISVGNEPPQVSIEQPGPDFRWRGGEPIPLRGTATDPEDGTPADVTWIVRLHHGGHTHAAQVLPGLVQSIAADDAHDADSFYEVTLRAQDAGELVDSETVFVQPDGVQLRLRSEPPGAPLTWSGESLVAPLSRLAAIGFSTSVGAAQSFASGGRSWSFERWSDGGSRLHALTVPAGGVDLTATYSAAPSPGAGDSPGDSGASTPKPRPKLSFDPDRGLRPRRGWIAGRASGPERIARVELALGRAAAPAASGHCRWWTTRAARARPCGHPVWLRARLERRPGGTVRWRLELGRALAPGRYRLIVRALDGAGGEVRLPARRWLTLRVRQPSDLQ